MHVVVTGSAGKVGREVVAALRRAGHQVTGFDLKGNFTEALTTVAVDCTDFGAVMGALTGVAFVRRRPDAIVHLAANPGLGVVPDHMVFATNTITSYNIFSAAARLGIKRVAWASSETVMGLPFRSAPAFVPLDESHPERPEWSYSLSKQMGEAMADSFARWSPELSIVSLRLSNVMLPSDYKNLIASHADPSHRKYNLWGYVDVRDAAEACRLAVEADLSGHQRLIIAAADTAMDTPSADLMAKYFPGVHIKLPLAGYESLFSSARAKKLIGYAPAHSWRENR